AYRPEPGAWPILTYHAKWAQGSAEDRASPICCPAEIDRSLAARLGGLAVAAFRAAGCRDYARVDLRLDARGEPMILEVNPNPDVGPRAGWARGAGRGYELRRGGRRHRPAGPLPGRAALTLLTTPSGPGEHRSSPGPSPGGLRSSEGTEQKAKNLGMTREK